MPYPTDHKRQTRERILDSAAELFAARGYDNVSIDQVMTRAGLTRGAFYAHFASKGELYAEALLSAANRTPLATTRPESGREREWIAGLIRGYLSGEHVAGGGTRCPMAFLVTDVAVREAPVRQTYTAIFQRMREALARAARSYSDCGEGEVLAATAMMIGAVAVGRALDDPAAVDELLEGCHATARRLLACDE